MTGRALVRAVIVALVGTTVLVTLMRIFPPLIGRHWEVQGAFVGAFLSSLLCGRLTTGATSENLRPAAGIVFLTFVTISSFYAVAQVTQHGQQLDFEPIGLFLWAVLATSWWLVPGTMLVLSIVNRILGRAPSSRRDRLALGSDS